MNFLKKGGSKKKGRVGASEKRERSKRVTKGEDIDSALKFKQQRVGRELSMVFGFIIAWLLAYYSSQSWLTQNHGYQPTGWHDLDKLLVGPGIEAYFGISWVDAGLAYTVRALAVWLLVGIIPYSAYLLSRMMGIYKDTSYFHLNWAVNMLWLLGIQLYLQFMVLYEFFVS